MQHVSDFSIGMDLGSTTVKFVILDGEKSIVDRSYERHHSLPFETAISLLRKASLRYGDRPVKIGLTGSAASVMAKKMGVSFYQEVIASNAYLDEIYPRAKSFVEIGGEDSKIILRDRSQPEIRMNTECAGGTGSFLDQICGLLQTTPLELNQMARSSETIYPVSARCGVFAKTDVQTLISRGIQKESIAASIFHAIALQVVGSLSRGRTVHAPILFAGGPLFFFSSLREEFIKILKIKETDAILPEDALFVPSRGVALLSSQNGRAKPLTEWMDLFERESRSFESTTMVQTAKRLNGNANVNVIRFPIGDSASLNTKQGIFLGVDSGSTTMKIVAMDRGGNFLGSWYQKGKGTPLDTFQEAFQKIHSHLEKLDPNYEILAIAVTGYGSEILKILPGTFSGPVETISHLIAARWLNERTELILDVGGQDIKAIKLENGIVDIKVNDACTSGSATFFESFATATGEGRDRLDTLAFRSDSSYALGTRCAVFINSKIKEALRDHIPIDHIAAGLIDSIVDNISHRLLDNRIPSGEGAIMLHGGGMKLRSLVHRISERIGLRVSVPESPELMGAIGAVLALIRSDVSFEAAGIKDKILKFKYNDFTEKELDCRACSYRCKVVRRVYSGESKYYSGNRCESVFSNEREKVSREQVFLYTSFKESLLLRERSDKPSSVPEDRIKIGIPLTLQMYDELPFWKTFLEECGFEVVLSKVSGTNRNVRYTIADDLCQPAKNTYEHVTGLLNTGVDRILIPAARYGFCEPGDASSKFQCPVITGMPDSIRSIIDPQSNFGVSVDSPEVQFGDLNRLSKALVEYYSALTGSKNRVRKAVDRGILEYERTRNELNEKIKDTFCSAMESKKTFVLLLGRPYIYDKNIINGVANWISGQGFPVLTEDLAFLAEPDPEREKDLENRWVFTDRIMKAIDWLPENANALVVHLHAFGCGPDATIADTITDRLKRKGIPGISLKLDGTGIESIRLRLRSALESLRYGISNLPQFVENSSPPAVETKNAGSKGNRTVLAPYLNETYQKLLPAAFRSIGINLEILPQTNKKSQESGAAWVGPDMCYPSLLVAGDLLYGLESRSVQERENLSVLVTETGGQCRASTYSNVVKQSLKKKGYESIPVMTFSTLHATGSVRHALKFTKRLMNGLIIVDFLYAMYHSSRSIETIEFESERILHDAIDQLEQHIDDNDWNGMLSVLEDAIQRYNQMEVRSKYVAPVGIVGEIYVKYNEFANRNLFDFLKSESREPVLPPMYNFFYQSFVNASYNHSVGLSRDRILNRGLRKVISTSVRKKISRAESLMDGYIRNRVFPDYHELSELRKDMVSLVNQYGEGWLLVAEIIALYRSGVSDILCLQPFGCISNHMMGKGMEKRLTESLPGLNLQFVDFDFSSSDANIRNRLSLFLQKRTLVAGGRANSSGS